MNKRNLSKAEKVRFSDFVATNLGEILDHIADFDVEAGNKFIREIIKKFRLLGENPLIGAVKHDLILNLRIFPFKNYNIFYFPTENGVEIYRVLHSLRDNVQIFDDTIDEMK